METKKEMCVIHLKGELYCQDAYYSKKDNVFYKGINCTIFNNKKVATKCLESDELKQAMDNFCNENHWHCPKLDIIPYEHSTEQKDFNVKLSEGELYFLNEVMYYLKHDLSDYGKDAPFFKKVYPSVVKKIKSLFNKSKL